MRLKEQQASQAVAIIRRHLGAQARVVLFGSRADDRRRGGDVDLYVETDQPVDLMDEVRCRAQLRDLFDSAVDLVVNDGRGAKPIFDIARKHGVLLSA